VVANGDIAALATDGSLNVFNHAGNTDVVIDVAGYFTPATPVNTNQTFTVSPSSAQTVTVSTASNTAQGVTTYTVSGLGTNTANIALFPCTGPNAPTGPNGQTTFSSTGGSGVAGNAAGEGATSSNSGGALSGGANPGVTAVTIASNTATAYITSINGVPANTPGGDGETIAYGITPNNGSVSFVLNSFAVDCAIPVVYTAPASAGTTPPLAVGTSGAPASGYNFGVGGSSVFNAAAAPAGTYTGYSVISTNPTANTFQATGAGGTFTFTYGQTGSAYNYDETPGTGGATTALPISLGQFTSDLSGVVGATPATSTAPATLGAFGDALNISYGGATSPSTFAYNGVVPGSTGSKIGDVPAAPAAVTATYQSAVTSGTGKHSAGVLLQWTAPANPDVYQYQVQFATVNASGVTSAFANAGNGYTVSGGVYTQNANAGLVSGVESASNVVTTAPLTNFFDPNQAGGTTVVYRIYAIADGNNASSTSPSTPNTAPLPIVASAVANVTGPLSTGTSYTSAAGTLGSAGVLAAGDTIDVNFNTPVSVSSSWSIEVVDASGNEALLNSSDSTASTANGGTTLIIQVGTVGSSTNIAPVIVANGLPVTGAAATNTWEILSAGGISGTGSGTPSWNVEASGAYNYGAANSTVIEGTTSVAVTRELLAETKTSQGANSNAALQAAAATTAPTNGTANTPVALNGASSTTGTANTITTTCNFATDYINIYNAAGTLQGSIACTATAATTYAIPSTITVTSGQTYIIGISPAAAPVYNNTTSKGQETATEAVLAS
ncbi:MAG: beta strand repeat-containing protein, partial [Acidimicrobiales bacterium]